MKRGKGLERRTRLVAKARLDPGDKPLSRRTPLSSSKGDGGALTRATTAKKAKSRPRTAPASSIALVKARSGGLCEIGLLCMGAAEATQTCHRMGKGSGGVGRKNTVAGTSANLIRGCVADHHLVDNAEVADAERLGLKVRHGVALPREMPLYHFAHGWVLLDDEGGHRPAPPASWDRSRTGGLLPVIPVDDYDHLGYVDVPTEVLERYGHLACKGYGWDEDLVVSCCCGATDLFIAEVSR